MDCVLTRNSSASRLVNQPISMEPFKIECGQCGQHLSATLEQIGRTTPCPACGTDVKITGPGGTASPTPPVSNPPPPPLPPPAVKPKLLWYQQLWIGWPILLVFAGGAIGGACGGGAWAINQLVFQNTKNPVLRYLFTGLISIAAIIAYFIIASVVLSYLPPRH